MNRVVVAVDPGGRTGLAASVVGSGMEAREQEYFARVPVLCSTITGSVVEQGLQIEHFVQASKARLRAAMNLRFFGRTVLVCESFSFSGAAMKDTANTSPELIGIVRWLAYQANWKLVMQQPAERSVITNDRLRRWGLWTSGPANVMSHQRDAVRHLCVYRRSLLSAV